MEQKTMTALSEHDVLLSSAFTSITSNVSTFAAATQLQDWAKENETRPATERDYLISEKTIVRVDQRPPTSVSPAWLGRVKKRLRSYEALLINWDSYGAVPLDPRVRPVAEDLIEWFAVDDMPPPDVFVTSEGGVQIEWHIRQVNIEIEISPADEDTILFHDLNSGVEWAREASSADLQAVRRRLLTNP